MMNVWNENTPEGLQRKLFIIISVELAWRGNEGLTTLVHHFKEELGNDGIYTGRIEYNPVFTKTTQGGERKCANSKNIKTDRLFLTVNPNWRDLQGVGWYKDVPVGKNVMGKWMNDSAKRAGLNTTDKKITNHSSRATAVSTLAKSGVEEQQIIKITGHSNANSIKPYLQLDK
ncbi:uncharacterized protein LOC116169118 [Photinus pyralis]|uniref:uncharacterized protein LOC116169118 n=1 Tax=Photinus pyralis TaxID=7054 RepID=UPI001266FB8B|nr:uncharacterized protein LOC116169118 [Photinus pyralis]